MNNDLKNLVRLQDIDLRIQELESSKKEFPKEVEDLEGAVGRASNDTAQIERKLEEAQKAKRDAEREIEDARNSLENTQDRLSKITTNREYDAVHAEIESHKHVLGNGETRLKTHSEEIAKLESALEEARRQQEELRGENEPRASELKERIATIDSEIAKVKEERDAVTSQISKPNLRPYERIRNRRKAGHAIGLISDSDRACPVCFKVLEVQLLNEIRKGSKLA
ncbi:MAG: hypothetical protein GF344_03210, partial [Chitinivibrionales bacterium]|nr:hypothetical protein [Chitinivibrionales bacterium]MBD3356087.1 hypothetical protein [Chitinivibrionales bacterium]